MAFVSSRNAGKSRQMPMVPASSYLPLLPHHEGIKPQPDKIQGSKHDMTHKT